MHNLNKRKAYQKKNTILSTTIISSLDKVLFRGRWGREFEAYNFITTVIFEGRKSFSPRRLPAPSSEVNILNSVLLTRLIDGIPIFIKNRLTNFTIYFFFFSNNKICNFFKWPIIEIRIFSGPNRLRDFL